jgi:hypothetical protein
MELSIRTANAANAAVFLNRQVLQIWVASYRNGNSISPVTGRVLVLEFCVQPRTQHRPGWYGKQASAMWFFAFFGVFQAPKISPWSRKFAYSQMRFVRVEHGCVFFCFFGS